MALGFLVLYCCMWELADLLGVSPKWPLIGVAPIMWLGVAWVATQTNPAVAGLIGLVIGVAAISRRIAAQKPSWADFITPLWIVAPIFAAFSLQMTSARSGPPNALAPNLVLLLAGPLWIGDTAALVFGKRFGKHPLAPKVSPNKTWEGSAANLAFSILTGIILSFFIGPPWWIGAAVGTSAGIFGQVGDLLQSALKRAADKKDSGGILPGHGGLLDRLDSLLFSFPFSYLVLLALMPAK